MESGGHLGASGGQQSLMLNPMSSTDMGTRSSLDLPLGSVEADREDNSRGSSAMSERLTPNLAGGAGRSTG